MVTTQLPVLCHLIWTHNVRTESLITNNVKKTDHVPAGKPVMSIHVLPDGYMLLPTAVGGILLMVLVARIHPLPDVRPVMP